MDPTAPLFAMSVLMGLGSIGLATNVAGESLLVVDPLLFAYAFFAVAFAAGAVHHCRENNHVATAAHFVAVVGWTTGLLGLTIAGPELTAFSLGSLGASGVALFFAGLQTVGLVGDPF
jgi:hypothetical protein